MTSNAKWAFARQEDAQKFIAENGGKLASFDEVLQAARVSQRFRLWPPVSLRHSSRQR